MKKYFSVIALMLLTGSILLSGCATSKSNTGSNTGSNKTSDTGSGSSNSDVKFSDFFTDPVVEKNIGVTVYYKDKVGINDNETRVYVIILGLLYVVQQLDHRGTLAVIILNSDGTRTVYSVSRLTYDQFINEQITAEDFFRAMSVQDF